MLENLTEQEKSVMLARAMGWEIIDLDSDGIYFEIPELYTQYTGGSELEDNLYSPANMALAWRVLNWADAIDLTETFILEAYLSPTEAQAAWLDKILELAIEAGLVQTGEKERQAADD